MELKLFEQLTSEAIVRISEYLFQFQEKGINEALCFESKRLISDLIQRIFSHEHRVSANTNSSAIDNCYSSCLEIIIQKVCNNIIGVCNKREAIKKTLDSATKLNAIDTISFLLTELSQIVQYLSHKIDSTHKLYVLYDEAILPALQLVCSIT
jgi:hypothetical protein